MAKDTTVDPMADEIQKMLGGDVVDEVDDSKTDDDIIDIDDVIDDDDKLDDDNIDDDNKPVEPTIADLMAKIDEQQETIKSMKDGAGESDDVEPSTDADDVQIVYPDLAEIDLFENHAVADVMGDENTFKEWINAAFTKVRKLDRDAVLEAAFTSIPKIIQKHVVESVEGKKSAEQFYDKHEDLVEHKTHVAKMANFVKENFPDLNKDEFFDKVADMTRSALNLEKQVKDKGSEKPGKKQKPALQNKPIKSKSKLKSKADDDMSPMEKEIQKMLNSY